MGPFEILCGIAAAVLALYYFLTSTYNFWKLRGIRGPRPIPGLGNFKDVMFNNISAGDYLTEMYNEYKDEPLIGIFARKTPLLIVKDLDLVKDILIKDFAIFADRGLPIFEKTEPLSQHLFSLEPKRWRPLRVRLSPVFTSGKLKEMFSLISKCADHLVEYMEKIANKDEPVECRELTAKYTTDVIGNCAFGIDMNALSNENSEFRKMGRKVFTMTWTALLRIRIRQMSPRLYGMLGYVLPQTDVTKFFTRVITENMNYRETNNIIRNDFIDMLRELKKHPDKLSDIDLTDTLIASQAFVFFLAGFETSSTTISNALYELALNQKVQDNLRKEINEVYAKYGEDLTYDNIKEMDYLNKVFKETLRKYPPVTFLMRQSMSSYVFDGTKINIPKDQKVWIPVYAIHRDPNIYPKPDVFDPERFNDEAERSRHPMSFLPFGDGPRNCIGSRFAIYQTKVGLVKILRNYKIVTCEKTPIPYVNNPKAFLLAPKDGLYLKIVKINQTSIKDFWTMGSLEILCGITALILAFYYFLTSTFNFWKSRGIRGPQPTPGFGNFKDVILTKISAGEYVTKVYNDYKDEALIGIFARMTPVLIVKDLDLIKDVLIKDFSKFAHRGLFTFEKAEPLSQHLFSLEPKRWRPMRMKLSPVFTSGKIKEMLSLISECADHLVEYMEKLVSKGEPIECRELTAKYTTDVIGSCAFGIDMNALSNEDSKFRKMGRKVFNPSRLHMLRIRIREIFPRFYNMLGYFIPQTEISKFFTGVITETMNYRETNNITRNDFVDTLRELKKYPDKLGDINLTDSLLASQAFVFFIAGFETSSTTISHALYELAINQKIQEKLREEIDMVYTKHGGDLIRDNIKEMNYLDKVFKETLRKYPPGTLLLRQSTSNYTFNGTAVSISENQKVWIPVYAIHRDPSIYPEPDVFNPERFNDEAVQERHPMSFLPFGDGPRNCIGARFAIYQSKVGLIKILQNYKVETCEKTPIPYISDPKAFVLCPKEGVYLKITKIN
ncbi:uncharacterized protein LOC105832463 [Monomorium pharaonis]|uniref:uncharacterized protein LOC105832463 n=1 Tax=Monomorium pharaonis TaxID=307658 RepID=UPI0017470FB6|nr:uncharacterized protein LOC105832463 [Monomorium pharaonis]